MQIFPVFISQKGCPYQCIYCNQKQFGSVQDVPFEILEKQIRQFCTKHKNQKKQIAFYGGTFTGLSLEEREKYFRLVEPFLDQKTSIRISTRPDAVSSEELAWCKSHQITTIELGIQDFTEKVLKASQRGYDRKTAIEACFRVKHEGFELGVQLLPGLPFSTPASHRETEKTLQRVAPQFVRLYPLIVLEGTRLWDAWEAGRFQPMSLDEAIDICVSYCEIAEYSKIEVIKIGIPSLEKGTKYIGPYHPAFGELVRGERLIRKIAAFFNSQKTICVSPKDVSLLTGHEGYNMKKLLKRLDLCTISIKPNSNLLQGEISFIVSESELG